MNTTVDVRGQVPPERRTGKTTAVRELAFAGLLTLFLVSVYLEVPLYVTRTFFVPAFFTLLVLVPVLGLIYHRRVRKYEALFVVRISLVLLLTALLSPGFEFVGQKLLGLLQTVVSIVSGILLSKLIVDLPRRLTARILFALSALILLGAALEVAGLLRGVSDAFRETVYGGEGGYFLYESEERDTGITGFVRPSLFVSEPSLVAIGFFAFVNSWLLLDYGRRNLVLTCLGTVLMLALTGSPVLVLSLIVTLVIMQRHRAGILTNVSAPILLGFAGLAIIVLNPTVASNLLLRLNESFDSYSVLNPTSEEIRLVFPLLTAIGVLKASPLFGVGITGKEVIGEFSELPISPDLALGTNLLALLPIYLGVCGSLLFAWASWDYLRATRIRETALLLVMLLAFSQMMGGLETPRVWGYVFLFVGVVRLHSRSSRWAGASGPSSGLAPSTRTR